MSQTIFEVLKEKIEAKKMLSRNVTTDESGVDDTIKQLKELDNEIITLIEQFILDISSNKKS